MTILLSAGDIRRLLWSKKVPADSTLGHRKVETGYITHELDNYF